MDKSKLLGQMDDATRSEAHAIVVEEMAIDPMAMLRRLHGVKIESVNAGFTSDGQKYMYQIFGSIGDRREVGTSAADLTGLAGSDWSDAVKAAETQAKRRLTTSLIGYGFKAPEGERKSAIEPVKPEEPAINHEPAVIIPEQPPTAGTPAVAVVQVFPVPQVSEETLAAMHKSAQKLDKSTSDPTAAPKEKPVPVPAQPVSDIFDEVVPDAQAQFHPSAAPTTEPIAAPEPVGEPEPMKDLEVPPATSEKPTRLQFQSFTARCTKLCRDVLPKAGKEVAATLLPYLRKVFNVQDLSQATCLQWESTLARLEGAKTPSEAAAIIKSGK